MDILNNLYEEYIVEYADPRVKNLPYMEDPKVALTAVFSYLFFVKILGPWIMKKRAPFELKYILVAYNGFQTIFSFSLFIFAIYAARKIQFNLLCQVRDLSKTDEYTLFAIKVSYIYVLSRFVEFADTIFFVLRKKYDHISTLHVVHHALVPLICWLGLKLEPAGHYNVVGVLNLFVHTFMYLYYMIAALGPQYKKFLWWKKYVTILQMGQFVIVFAHTVQTILTDCPVNKLFGYLILFQSIFFYKLFLDFYQKSFGNITDGFETDFFNLEKHYEKYRKLFEMCIPNQHVLMADDDNEDNKSHND